MKKYKLLVTALLLTSMLAGCAKNTENENTDSIASTADTSAAEVTTAALTEAPAESTAETTVTETETVLPEEETFSLKNLTSEEKREIVKKLLEKKNGSGKYIFNQNASASLFRVVSSDEFSVSTAFEADLYRESTNLLCTEDEDRNSFNSAIAATKWGRYADDMSAYDIWESNVKIKVKADEKLDPEIVSITQSYTINDLSFNAFVSKNKSGNFDVIIDPAYMYEIPVPIYIKNFEYNINGIDALMDSVSFTADKLNGEFNYSDYVYAAVTVDSLTVSCDSLGNNYSHAPKITSFEVLYENAAEAISSTELLKKFDAKNDGSAAVYNTLTDNIKLFMGEDIMGVNLIDLDFDGTPELLVTRTVQDEIGDGIGECADVDIYSINDGKLNLIDTLYNSKTNIYQTGNIIGLKTNDKLEKEWFTMSRKNVKTGENQAVDYLFKLKDGKLEYTEVFRSEVVSYKPESDAPGEINYYFYGEKLEFDSYEGPHPYDSDDPWTYYSWNGITATFGEWELWGFIRQKYCEGIEQSFNLYSSWLSVFNAYEDCEKLTLNERTMKYKLAYLVDSFYYGEYNPAKMEYKYWFLGDYAKPVIYLYPEEKTDISVKVELDGGALTCTYPDYRDGWNVTAYPDGTIIDNTDGEEYYCLYWEGVGKSDWDMSKGFVVKREDTADFLRSKLKEIGLTPRESNEFIIYWLPELMKNECNLITFQTTQYEKNAVLDIDPVPDSILRIFMVYEPCSEDTEIEPQEFEPFERNGFTVIEWGGSRGNS